MTTATSARPLRVGLVGAGTIAQLAELPALSDADGVSIAGVVTATGRETQAALDRWPIQQGYDSVEDLVSGANLDALFVLTPKDQHVEPVRLGLEAGLDVFCEKPLTTSIEDSELLVELEAQSRGRIMVGFNRRFAEVYRLAHDEFQRRELQFVVAQKNRVGSEHRATLENGVHLVDLLRWFCGEAVSVSATARYSDPYQEDGVQALVQFDSGVSAVVAILRCAGEWDERMELYGDRTTVRVVAPDSVAVTRDGSTNSIGLVPRANGWNNVTASAGFAGAIHHFLDCVRSGESPLTSASDALKTQRLMDWILSEAGLPSTDPSEFDQPTNTESA